MSESSHERLELTRIGRGTDLWPAIEAAQYAHLIDHEEARSAAERETISAFASAFARWAEEWEERPREVRSTILDDLGRHLAALAGHGLFLYAATTEREVATEIGASVRIPVALLRISRTSAPRQEIRLPTAIDAD